MIFKIPDVPETPVLIVLVPPVNVNVPALLIPFEPPVESIITLLILIFALEFVRFNIEPAAFLPLVILTFDKFKVVLLGNSNKVFPSALIVDKLAPEPAPLTDNVPAEEAPKFAVTL